jgi:hypothetical protein
MAAMKTLEFWTAPAIFAALWISAMAFTLSELATLSPSLRSIGAQASRSGESTSRSPEARRQAARHDR